MKKAKKNKAPIGQTGLSDDANDMAQIIFEFVQATGQSRMLEAFCYGRNGDFEFVAMMEKLRKEIY